MTDERSSNSILRKTISEPQPGIEPQSINEIYLINIIIKLTYSGFHLGRTFVELAP